MFVLCTNRPTAVILHKKPPNSLAGLRGHSPGREEKGRERRRKGLGEEEWEGKKGKGRGRRGVKG